jgi:hypothetical protein
MAVLALAAGGSLLGGVLAPGVVAFGMTGASIGWLAGSMLGNALFNKAPHQYGPRITDLGVQASTYGTAIPRVWGTFRVAGNVVWCTDKRERSKTERAGKGGGPKVTTYTYDVDIAIALCSGPAKVRKIWNNGKLIADFSEGAGPETWNASAVGAQGFTLYQGTEDQLPDPLYEADVGAGKAPAFRGICYVVFERLDCPGGQIPQLSFEVVVDGETTTETETVQGDATVTANGNFYGAAFTSALEFYGAFAHSGEVENQVVATFEAIDGDGARIVTTRTKSSGGVTHAGWGVLYPGSSDVPGVLYRRRFEDVLEFMGLDGIEVYLEGASNSQVTWRRKDGIIVVLDNGAGIARILPTLARLALPGTAVFSWLTESHLWIGGNNYNGAGAGAMWLRQYDRGDFAELATQTWTAGEAGKPHTMFGVATYEESGSRLWLWCGNGNEVNDNALYLFDGDTSWEQVGPDMSGVYAAQVLHVTGSVVNIGHWFDGETFGLTTVNLNAIGLGTVELGTIITEICALAGVTAVAAELTNLVQGYASTRVSTARALLEPLVRAYFLDVRETDGVLEFVRRADPSVVATIPYEELGAAAADAEPSEPFPLERANADELPRSVAVNYISQPFEYETGTESTRRYVVEKGADIVEDLPIVFTAGAEPAGIAQGFLYEAWANRNRRQLRLTRKYAHLDAGDHVQAEYPEGTLTRVRLDSVSDDGVVVSATCVPVEPSVYTGTAEGSTDDRNQTVDGLPGDTELILLDIPILRDADDGASPYAALAGRRSSWRGAVLYAGASEAALEEQGSVTAEAVTGQATNALGAWTANLVDELNRLTIRTTGELFSITHQRMLASTDNAFALGVHGRWEICQFREAEDNGDGTYTLSGLRRGLRGTEHAAGSHAIGDFFVLLDGTGLLKPALDVAQLGVERTYKAISVGNTEGNAQTFTSEGESLTPLAPVNLRAAKQSNGDIVFSWVRRTRLAENWLRGVVPLGEESQSWQLVVRGRTLTSTTPTVTYTAAQQAADGGPFTSGTVTVAQVSATVGVGHVLSQSITT